MTPPSGFPEYKRKDFILYPLYALLSGACLFPFVAHVDVLMLHHQGFDLLGIYGSEYIVLSIPSLILTAIIYIMKFTTIRMNSNFVHNLFVFSVYFLFSSTILYSIFFLTRAWTVSHGIQILQQTSVIWCAVVAALISGVAIKSASISSLLADWGSAARAVAILGLATLPFAAWQTRDDALPPLKELAVRDEAPNVVLITIDTLSAPNMSLYGAKRPTTPHIDSFARKASVFDRAFAASTFTTPGANTILTGEYPSQHRAILLASRPRPSSRQTSLPARLKAKGYYTGFVSTNGWAGPIRNGYGRYFDFKAPDHRAWNDTPYRDEFFGLENLLTSTLNPFVKALFKPLGWGRSGNGMNEPKAANTQFAAFMEQRRAPFFFWIHYVPPHDPYAAPAPWLGRFDANADARTPETSLPVYGPLKGNQTTERTQLLRARYDEALAWLDHGVGEILRRLNEPDLQNTIVVITSDHGETFSDGWGAHGNLKLHRDVLHIPLIVRLPFQKTGQRIPTPVGQTDVLPLILGAVDEGASYDVAKAATDFRKNGPVLAMNFKDSKQFAALDNGSIGATDGRWLYVLYQKGHEARPGVRFEEFTDLEASHGRPIPGAAVPSEVASVLRSAVVERLKRDGNAIVDSK